MNHDSVVGTTKNLGGKVQEGIGRDARMQADGLANQATGAAQDVYGQVKDSASEVRGQMSERVQKGYDATIEGTKQGAEIVKDAAIAGHDFLKRFMDENPHTTTIIALGIGLLIGYASHRPPPQRSWWNEMTSSR
jgi:uncharacterized protein YjbJ (UPF0337 family)